MNKELLEYFNGDELASSVWENKYRKEGETTPRDMHWRMAKEFARIEKSYQQTETRPQTLSEYGRTRPDLDIQKIFDLFDGFKYVIPQGSIMSQLGSGSIGSLSNCFFVGQPEDSYAGIMEKDEMLVQLMKRRGGVGIDISTLRPAFTPTSNAAKTSTGAVSFMDRFSNTTREVSQHGRRGALLISMEIEHPDSLDFIKIKQDLTKVTGANISVKLSDEFLKAVEGDQDYMLKFPTNTHNEAQSMMDNLDYNKLIPLTESEDTKPIKWFKKVKAKEYWDEIIKSAHNTAEPGLLFWDNILNNSLDGVYDKYRPKGLNPCSEVTLSELDSCRLIAVNLFSFVTNPFTEHASFDYDKFYNKNYEAMRLSDDLIDLELEHVERIIKKIEADPEPQSLKQRELDMWKKVYDIGKEGRRTGLGFTALADVLAALGVKYGSEESIAIIDAIMQTKLRSELDCTTDMAIVRGTFDGWDVTEEFDIDWVGNNKFYRMLQFYFPKQAQRMQKYGRRNISFSTAAPTGSVSILAQTSSGIEPLFKPFYTRRKKINPSEKDVRVDFVDANGDSWQEYQVLHPKFKEWYIEATHTQKIPNVAIEALEETSEENLQAIFKLSPWYNSTAEDIKWEDRVKVQATLQKYITQSISSTINLPKETTKETVGEIYMEAWKQGLKGLTVYRDGSRDGVLISNKEKAVETHFNENNAPKRPKKLEAKVLRFNNDYEKWVAFIGLYEGRPYEIFTGRLGSLELPPKVEEGFIEKRLNGDNKKSYFFNFEDGESINISKAFDKTFWNYAKLISSTLRHGMPIEHVVKTISELTFEEEHINSWKYGVVRALKKYIKDGVESKEVCPECGGTDTIRYEEGCKTCSCGWSKCG